MPIQHWQISKNYFNKKSIFVIQFNRRKNIIKSLNGHRFF